MRIAMIGQQGIPARHGGVEKAVEELSARLAERGHEVHVFNRWTPGRKLRRHRGIRLRYVPAFGGKYLGNLSQSAMGTALAALGGYDVIHFHALGPCLAAPSARLRSRSRIVVTLQGRDDQRAKWSRPAQMVLGLAAWLSANVPHARIAVSRQLQREFAEEFGVEATHIPNGVAAPGDEVPVTDDPLERFGLEPGRYLLNVGRLVPEKAIDQLLTAYPNVPGDVRVAIVGGSSHTEEYLEQLRELAARDPRIVLTGPIYGAEKDRIFRNALGYVMPSLLEGLPLALLEAISYGLPVVVSDIEPHLEVVSDDGPGHRVFRTGDLDHLAKQITTLVNESELEQAAARQLQQRVLVEYSWETVTDKTETLYEQLVAEAAR